MLSNAPACSFCSLAVLECEEDDDEDEKATEEENKFVMLAKSTN
jgi:hypothetical protein